VTDQAPSSTYRLQIRAGFPLPDAAALVGYLRDLGVGAIYSSPLLQATPGSDHGYDTVDVTRIDAERGGQAGFDTLLAATRRAGLGLVVDIVPNHLGVAVPYENPAWWDVLARGRESPYAAWFDIDWSRGRVVLPVLVEPADRAPLQVVDGELRYYEHRFPLAAGTWAEGDDPAGVHDRQHYELVHWTRANHELNYRRFFAITTLAGVRQEDEAVFAATHVRVRDWVSAGVTGLRIDHPDGLADPAQYLARLRALAPDAWIVVEKILEPGERLPKWPVAGTTGYDALAEVGGLFVDPDAEATLTATYLDLTGDPRDLAAHVEAGKRLVTDELLPAERRRMAALAPDVVDAESAIGELAVAFGVYRSYLPDGVADLDAALALARRRRPDLAPALDAMDSRLHDPGDELAVRMQQLSGATMAKGTEDTAYYRYARFVALNEVGGNPTQFGLRPAAFHAAQAGRQAHQPHSMTTLSTHDTKRGEDVRARLAVLAELPEQWREFARTFLEATAVPNRMLGYLLAQTLLGAGPIAGERMHAYAEKAMREACDGTRWVNPNEAFEAGVHEAVDLAYEDPALRAAWAALAAQVEGPGWTNALGQKLTQLTMPGVPDVYQGTELWDDSLVDPDNRRPVHFAHRRELLGSLAAPPPVDASGAAKLWVTSRALRARRDFPDRFDGYAPIEATGPAAEHLVGFDRGGAVTLATRLPVRLAAAGGWGETALVLPRPARDVLTGRSYAGQVVVADLLADLPVALLLDRDDPTA